jgi:signal transduction histidine kinase/putative methionine-R-sulfoxide reductase with GAF domain
VPHRLISSPREDAEDLTKNSKGARAVFSSAKRRSSAPISSKHAPVSTKQPLAKNAPSRTLSGERDELRERRDHERQVADALKQIARAMGHTETVDALLALVVQKMAEVVDAERATFYLREQGTGDLVSRVSEGDRVQHIRLKVGEGLAGHVAKTGRPLVVADAYEDPRFNRAWDKKTGYRTTSVLVVPVSDHDGKTIGVAQVLNKRSGSFTQSDSTTLSVFATQAAISLDHYRLLESLKETNAELLSTKGQLERRVRDLRLLFELESTMGRVTSLDELLVGILSEAKRVVNVEFAAFMLRERDADLPTLHVIEGKKLVRYPVAWGEGIIGASMATGEIIMSVEARRDPRGSRALDKRVGVACRNALCVPLGSDGETFGALGLYNKLGDTTFGDEDRNLVQLIAANATTAINLQWSRDSREREERLTTIGRLLSGVIHDLKTPLSIISGYVDLMRGATDKKLRNDYADLVLKQFSFIGAMQRDVLEFARGEKTLLVRKVYLTKFFEEVRSALEIGLAKNHIKLEVVLRDRGVARFDEGKVLRLIQNLARNASEAMVHSKGGGTFRIEVTRKAGVLVMSFTDTGPGIPSEIESRLFQSFVTSGKKGGTGLGLAIVKRVVDEHGGSIQVKSSSKGATFRVALPQRAESNHE